MSVKKNISNIRMDNKEGYNQWSGFYDDYPNPTVAMDEKSFPAFWCHHARQKILEVGCGTGRHTQKLIRRENHVTALDLSPGMLEIARKKVQSDLVEFIEADFTQYSNLSTNYDVVLESLVLEHFPNINMFFEKAAAVLKENGDLYLSEIHPSRTQEGVMAHFKVAADQEMHLTSYCHKEEDFQSAARGAGFRQVNAADVCGDDSLGRLNEKWSRHLGKPMIRIWHFRKD